MDKKMIKRFFPEINEINSIVLQEKTVRAFQIAIEQGGWNEETIKYAPVTLNWDKCKNSLIDHIRDVTHLAKCTYHLVIKYYENNGVALDWDLVICGSLLHDIGKFTEYTMEEGEIKHSNNYKLMRHPLSGAIIASKAELPDSVIHLIAVHSYEGKQSYQSSESKFVREIDEIVFSNSVCGLKKIEGGN